MIKNIERTKDGVDTLIDRTHDAVVGATDRAERGVESAAERVVKKSHLAGKYVRGATRTASDGAHERVADAAKAIDKGYTRVRGDLSDVATAATDYVSENPGKAVLVAASAGFVLGLLARRRALPARDR